MCKTNGKIWLFLAAFLAMGASEKSVATVISLGSVSSATTLHIDSDWLSAPFSDSYLFTIDAGKAFDFSSFTTTGFTRLYSITDFAGSLYGSSGLVATGVAATRHLPEGFPAFDVSFPSVLLSAGDYTLQLTGTPYSVRNVSASYRGTATFSDATSAVPEPNTLALMGLALVGLGALRYGRPATLAS